MGPLTTPFVGDGGAAPGVVRKTPEPGPARRGLRGRPGRPRGGPEAGGGTPSSSRTATRPGRTRADPARALSRAGGDAGHRVLPAPRQGLRPRRRRVSAEAGRRLRAARGGRAPARRAAAARRGRCEGRPLLPRDESRRPPRGRRFQPHPVRSSPGVPAVKAYDATKFQFHSGSIKTLVSRPASRATNTRFNSTLVRLRPSIFSTGAEEFQA